MYPQTQKCNIDGVNLRQVLYMGASFCTFAVLFFQSGPGLGGSGGGEEGHRGIGVHVKETQKCSSNPKKPTKFFRDPKSTNVFTHQRLLDDCISGDVAQCHERSFLFFESYFFKIRTR